VYKVLILLLLLPTLVTAQVPGNAVQYQGEMTRSAYRIHGPGAPVAALAAQIHQESGWDCNAVSWAGAEGCGQFMPGTSKDAARRWPEDCAPVNTFSDRWAFNCRDRHLKSLTPKSFQTPPKPLTPCDDFAFRLRAYNGGWRVKLDRKLAGENGFNPDSWVEVGPFNASRRESAYIENKEYPERIFKLEPRYASWGRQLGCAQ